MAVVHVQPSNEEGVPTNQGTGGDISEEYAAALERIRKYAIMTCIRVKGNCFLELCALTWATTVLLGGIVTSLKPKEFLVFAALLLAQALHFGAVVSWRGFLPDTSLIIHRRSAGGRRRLCRGSSVPRIAWRFLLFLVIECVYLESLFAALMWGAGAPSSPKLTYLSNSDKITVLSIYIFYFLSVSNAQISQFGLLIQLWRVYSSWPCVMKYYDKLVWRGLTKGLHGLKQLEAVDAAFEMMSQEFRTGRCKPEEVYFAYEHMIEYVYNHDRGLEAALMAMESSDRYVQEAAVHMVGFWADHHEMHRPSSQRKLRFAKALLRRLVGLCTDNAGGAIAAKAARSIEKLVRADTKGILRAVGWEMSQVLVKQVVEMVDVLQEEHEELILIATAPQHEAGANMPAHLYETLLYTCKVLALLLDCDADCFRDGFTSDQRVVFATRLMYIFRSCHASWTRMRVVVGYALQRLDPHSLTEELVLEHFKGGEAAAACHCGPHGVMFDEEQAWFAALVRMIRDDAARSACSRACCRDQASTAGSYAAAMRTLVLPKPLIWFSLWRNLIFAFKLYTLASILTCILIELYLALYFAGLVRWLPPRP